MNAIYPWAAVLRWMSGDVPNKTLRSIRVLIMAPFRTRLFFVLGVTARTKYKDLLW